MFAILSFSGALIHGAIYLLEALFAVGIIGSAIVVVLTAIEDTAEVMSKEEPTSATVERTFDSHAPLAPSTH